MWEELTKLTVRCKDHEAVDLRCATCKALVRNGNKLLQIKLARDGAIKEVRGLLESKKAIITNFK